ncbi:hypothetical protein BC936DRAFT_145999 [Jimgerdemannia flammicorona]|uniref:Uncharacterized protein n=1 Tax=Jimgerdemannia flammicorona TaxID=994334 RepID=A0A433D8Q5_9FUNG|nr:hypothetical protein BC936DRAFT_145999 [Jimgerdemannia flammicorona]
MTPNDLCAQRWRPRLLQEEVDVRSGFTREGESDVCMKTIWEEVNGGRLGRFALDGREMRRAGSGTGANVYADLGLAGDWGAVTETRKGI